jgi:hypothetical protein
MLLNKKYQIISTESNSFICSIIKILRIQFKRKIILQVSKMKRKRLNKTNKTYHKKINKAASFKIKTNRSSSKRKEKIQN